MFGRGRKTDTSGGFPGLVVMTGLKQDPTKGGRARPAEPAPSRPGFFGARRAERQMTRDLGFATRKEAAAFEAAGRATPERRARRWGR